MLFAEPIVLGLHENPVGVCTSTLFDAGDTFVIAFSNILRVYGASSLTLLHEFNTIHPDVQSVHYTSFSDSILTLERDLDNKAYYLCVYHDWRVLSLSNERVVRGYTLPLAAEYACSCVCSYSGRVAVAAHDRINIWQCNDGFFEHVFELQVTLDTVLIEHVTLHGDFLAVATSTEVRVFNIQVSTTPTIPNRGISGRFHNTSSVVMKTSDEIPILHVPILHQTQESESQELLPASDDENVNDLLHGEDIRVNESAGYRMNKARVLLRRFQQANRGFQSIRFLPETVGAQDFATESAVSVRLLVSTALDAHLFYFLPQSSRDSEPAEGNERLKITEIVHGSTPVGQETEDVGRPESVVSYYHFTAPVSCVTATSSYLFAISAAGVEVWSIWSPCRHDSAAKALGHGLHLRPENPILLGIQSLAASDNVWFIPNYRIAALDSYVMVLAINSPQNPSKHSLLWHKHIMERRVQQLPFELRPQETKECGTTLPDQHLLVLQLASPTRIYRYIQGVVQTSTDGISSTSIDMLLSLFSLFRYRADIVSRRLQRHHRADCASLSTKEYALTLTDMQLYSHLAQQCAADLALVYTHQPHLNLERAASFFAVSDLSPEQILDIFVGLGSQGEVLAAVNSYLEAAMFSTKGKSQSSSLTECILNHFSQVSLETIVRLVVDAALEWKISELEHVYTSLQRFKDDQSESAKILQRTACVVVLGRVTQLNPPTEFSNFNRNEIQKELGNLIEWLSQHSDVSLSHLFQMHPELLYVISNGSIQPSDLAEILGSAAPDFLVEIMKVLAVREQPICSQQDLDHQTQTMNIEVCLNLLGQSGRTASIGIQDLMQPQPDLAFLSALQDHNDTLFGPLRLLNHFIQSRIQTNDPSIREKSYLQSVATVYLCCSLSRGSGDIVNIESQSRFDPLPKWAESFVKIELGNAVESRQLLQLASQDFLVSPTICATILEELNGVSSAALLLGLKLIVWAKTERFDQGYGALQEYPQYLFPYAQSCCTNRDDWQEFYTILWDWSLKNEVCFNYQAIIYTNNLDASTCHGRNC